MLGGGVEAVDISLVVVLVMQLHDLAGDRGFKRAIVVCCRSLVRGIFEMIESQDEHGRSGSVALPRTKLVLVMAAAVFEAPALRAVRAAVDVRRRVADMIADLLLVIQLQLCFLTEKIQYDERRGIANH